MHCPDHLAIAAGPDCASLAFDDLALVYRLRDDAATTRYLVTALDRDGHPIAAAVAGRADPDGHAVVGAIALASDRDGYTLLRITTTRPPTVVHVARDPGLAPAARDRDLARPVGPVVSASARINAFSARSPSAGCSAR